MKNKSDISAVQEKTGPLVGFDGKRIRINRKGIFTPVDVELEYTGKENILKISANILFLEDYSEDIDMDTLRSAVLEGMSAWAGEYEVFGNQKLQVKVELTADDRLLDSVYVIPLTEGMSDEIVAARKIFASAEESKKFESFIRQKRSFAGLGIKRWSVNSLKVIAVQSADGNFDDYEEIMHVAKHEFGHVLGLGDLYQSPQDGLDGVAEGTYGETDKYHLFDRVYNLVMCDHHGPISNNDIEMVVLAFSENCMQNYQISRAGQKISEALGKGN